MIANVYLDSGNFGENPLVLDTFELPIKNIDLNDKIDIWIKKKLELDAKGHSSFYMDINSTDLYGKIVAYDFNNFNEIFFLYNILKDHNLLDEFNMYWKYHARGNLKEINSGEFFVMIREILSKTFPDHENEITYETFKDDSFLEKIPGTTEYIFKRQDATCRYLKERTGFDWKFYDDSISYWGTGYCNETVEYLPKIYCSIDYDPDIPTEKLKDSQVKYYYGKYQISVVNNIFKVHVYTKIFNKIRDVKDNRDLLYYVSSNGFEDPIFTAIAYSWDEVFEFIDRVNKFEHNIRKENGMLDDLDAYINKDAPIKEEEDDYNKEINRITKSLQTNVDKKLKNFKKNFIKLQRAYEAYESSN